MTARESAVAGVATASINSAGTTGVQLSVIKRSASGAGQLTGRPVGCPGFEPIYAADGSTPLSLDLSRDQQTYVFDTMFSEIRVSSDNATDEFEVFVLPR